MGRAWNEDLLGVIADSDGILIVLLRGVVRTVLQSDDQTAALPGDRLKDLTGANLQVLVGQRDAASFLL
jgi:hypothetical protein